MTIGALGAIAVLTFTSLALEQWRRIPDVWSPVVSAAAPAVPVEIVGVSDRAPAVSRAAQAVLGRAEQMASEVAESSHRWQLRPWMALMFGFDVLPLGVVNAMMVMVPGGASRGDPWWLLASISAVATGVLVMLSFEELCAALVRRKTRRQRREAAPPITPL